MGRKYSDPTGDDKTSVYFSFKNEVGALHAALDIFKRNGINLTKIESRPSRNKAWEYLYFVDFEGHAEDPNVKAALTALEKHCSIFNVLGSYPRAEA
ncbi:MAG: prephenate dehydratase [Kiritimatiellales bacterium]